MKKVRRDSRRMIDARAKRLVNRVTDKIYRRYTDGVVNSLVDRAKGMLEKAAGAADSAIQRAKAEGEDVKDAIAGKKKLLAGLALLSRIPTVSGGAAIAGGAAAFQVLGRALPLISAAAVLLNPARLASMGIVAVGIKAATALIKKAMSLAKSGAEDAVEA